jgi:carbamoyl-phosphate synthase large subunit
MKKNIMIIGGGYNQLNLIKSAKEVGYNTVVIDPNINAPGKELADIFYNIDPNDFDSHCKVIEKHSIKGIVTTQMDKPIQFMAKIASKYEFSFISEDSALWARNKIKMKERFILKDVPCAKGVIIEKKSFDISEKTSTLCFPLIMKPVDSYSSRGVYIVTSIEEIISKFEKTSSFSTDGSVLVEEFISGKMISIEGYIFKQKIVIVQYTERYKFTPEPLRVELGHIQPATLTDSEKRVVNEVLINGLNALGLDNCGFHAELIINENGAFIIEIGARLGGDFNASHLVPNSTGINIEKIIVSIAMGDVPVLPERKDQFVMIKWLELKEKKIISTLPDLNKILIISENIVDAKIQLHEGSEVPVITDSSKRPGYVIVKGKTRDEVIKIALEAEKIIQNQIQYA